VRLILKTIDGHFKEYWIILQKQSVIGWFSGDWIKNELGIANDLHFECHFTLPPDGNAHHSYKFINTGHEDSLLFIGIK
jgi:hypothetical protein